MELDVPTLMLAGAFVATLSGALLLFAWYQYRETEAALWWAGADGLLAAAIVLMAVGSVEGRHVLFFTGLTLLTLSAALSWGGARSFEGQRASPVLIAAGPLLWLATQGLPLGLSAPETATMIHTAIAVAYYAAAAWGIRHGRDALRARLPLAAFLTIHALTLLIAVPASLTHQLQPDQPPPVLSWFGVIHFETLVFVIGTAIFMVAIMKERSEGRHLSAAFTDALTGLVNRRGFLDRGGRIVERCRREGAPAAVVVFDLDRFKTINDRFGHPVGDRALQIFAEVCRSTLRSDDVVGRIGGEEFAAILPGFGVEAGMAMGERVRKAFAQAALVIDGRPVGATLSGGVASLMQEDTDLAGLLALADTALYGAKDRGRDRIEAAARRAPGHDARVARIA